MEDPPINDMDYVLINQLSNITQDISEFDSIENSNLLNMNFLNLNDIKEYDNDLSEFNNQLNRELNKNFNLDMSNKMADNRIDHDVHFSIDRTNTAGNEENELLDINDRDSINDFDFNDEILTQATTPENSLNELLYPAKNISASPPSSILQNVPSKPTIFYYHDKINHESAHHNTHTLGNEESNISNTNTINPKQLLSNKSSENLVKSNLNNLNFKNDLLINDECFNAISYWLNNQTNEISKIKIPILTSNSNINANSSMISKNISKPVLETNSSSITPIITNTNTSSNSSSSSPTTSITTTLSSKLKTHLRRNSIQITSTIDSQSNSYNISKDSINKKRRKSISVTAAQTSAAVLASSSSSSTSTSPTTSSVLNSKKYEEDFDKPFNCSDCLKQFKRSEHLKRHIRSVHSNIRPFHCKYCEKKFSRSDNLAQHLKTHKKLLNN